ncbi:MAG: hypothetical protein Q7S78_00550 [Candidatus Azambacteria bacterium]|nr:hypothetical protein [Candidatus Azambacteria bacterium]
MVELVSQKPKISLPTWHWPLWVSIGLVFLSAAAFVFLKVYLAQIQTEIININEQIKAEAAKVNTNDENAMLRLNDSLGSFNGLAANHSYFSSALETIGALTYKNIIFTKLDADREKGIIQLKGMAQNYTALAKQIVALRGNENFKSMEIKGINFGVNGLEFELMAGVISDLFIKK